MNNIRLKRDREYYRESKGIFLRRIHGLRLSFEQRKINNLEYQRQLNQLLKGRTIDSWLNYYDSNIRGLERELRLKGFETRGLANRKILFIIILCLLITVPLMFVLKNTYTGYVVYNIDKEDVYIKNGLVNEEPKGNHAVMKFDHVLSQDEKEELEDQGIKLLSYIPDNTWIVSTAKDVKRYRISKDNKINFKGLMRNEDNTVNLTVIFYNDADADAGLLGDVYLISKVNSINGLIISTDINNLDNLLENEDVQWIEPQLPEPIIFNDGSRESLGVDILQGNYNLTGSFVTIGLWDAGHADNSHYDLVDRVVYGDVSGVQYHSTHVAGTTIGDGNQSSLNNGYEMQWRGMAPNATIISYEWFNDNAELEQEYMDAISNYSIDVSTNSWGLNVGGYYPCEYMGNYTTANIILDDIVNGGFGRKVLVIWAAGNDRSRGLCGTNKSNPSNNYMNIPPYGTGKNVLTVGAINSDDDSMTSYSSWGPTDDGRIKPELVAPGDERIGDGGIKSTIPGNRYTVYYGTSMAAPAVAGVSALMIDGFVNEYGYKPWPSMIKAILINTAIDLGRNGPDYSFGYGRINATAAVESMDSNKLVNDTLVNSSMLYKINIVNETELRLTLVWDDASPTINSVKQLVNNLDLVVFSPDSTRYYPFTLDKNNPSQAALINQSDNINVIEQVLVDNPENGEWNVIVNNTGLITQQEFSLVSNIEFSHKADIKTTLVSPQDNLFTNDTGITFNCSAASGSGLQNISLYTDITGNFILNQIGNVSGVYNSTLFNLNLPDGVFIWNCLSYDNNFFYDWGDENYTIIIDTLSPEVILLNPEDNVTINQYDVSFSYSVLDESNVTCSMNLNGDVDELNSTEFTKTLSNGDYVWSIVCVDLAGNANNSEIRSFAVNYMVPEQPPVSSGGSGGGSGGGGGGSKKSRNIQEEREDDVSEEIEKPFRIPEEQKPSLNQIIEPIALRKEKQFKIYYYTPFLIIILYLLINLIRIRRMKYLLKKKRFIKIKR